jgi:hypothetical protein
MCHLPRDLACLLFPVPWWLPCITSSCTPTTHTHTHTHTHSVWYKLESHMDGFLSPAYDVGDPGLQMSSLEGRELSFGPRVGTQSSELSL